MENLKRVRKLLNIRSMDTLKFSKKRINEICPRAFISIDEVNAIIDMVIIGDFDDHINFMKKINPEYKDI